MTMSDMKCDVCGTEPAIGVACTAIPYSCAYCIRCANIGAQPEIVFSVWWDACNGDLTQLRPECLDTPGFKDGNQITFKQWAEGQKP